MSIDNIFLLSLLGSFYLILGIRLLKIFKVIHEIAGTKLPKNLLVDVIIVLLWPVALLRFGE